jgi:DNA invertase Pin-like site-specific DNA recombinase
MFQMLGVFAEFERGIIRERVNAGLARARANGTKLKLGRRPVEPSVEIRIRELILLRHKRRRFDCRMQQGQRERFLAMATISLRRIVAIEFGM